VPTPEPPEQYQLFAPQPDADLSQVREKAALLQHAADSPNSVLAYAHSWRMFCRWCANWRHCEALPAPPGVVREYLAWASEVRTPAYKPATLQLALASIRRMHKEAGKPLAADPDVTAVMSGIVRRAARNGARAELAGKRHLTVEQLKKVCAALGSAPVEVRNRALLLLGFTSALRRSNLARVETDHVHFDKGHVRLWVPNSKTDQRGAGRDIFLHPAKDPALCVVAALQAWKAERIKYCGYFRGPLILCFTSEGAMTQRPLSPRGICRAFQQMLERAGIPSRDYGAHSMRSGMITSAHEAGANLRSIMERSGHRSVTNVMRYIKPVRESDPLKGVL
jgi:integrase